MQQSLEERTFLLHQAAARAVSRLHASAVHTSAITWNIVGETYSVHTPAMSSQWMKDSAAAEGHEGGEAAFGAHPSSSKALHFAPSSCPV